jgi:hypothetical protein
MLLSIPATVTVSFGATYHFGHFLTPPRVTKLLAQIAARRFLQKPVARPSPFVIFRPPFPGQEAAIKTINRQLFFVWLDNAFVFASRPLTIGSLTNPPATSPTP